MNTCKQCGKTYSKRPSEAYWQYRDRKFCSRPCADLGRERGRVANKKFKARYRQITTPDGRKMLEHRWVMQQVLGRPLTSAEHVHHKDHDGLNNDPANLEVVTVKEHALRHTWRPTVKVCAVCKVEFPPHKTKRSRAQTCAKVTCSTELRATRRSKLSDSDVIEILASAETGKALAARYNVSGTTISSVRQGKYRQFSPSRRAIRDAS